jgi:uncharacterized membrane protein
MRKGTLGGGGQGRRSPVKLFFVHQSGGPPGPSGRLALLVEMERTDLGRIVAFSDGVMAVAITLLVLNLEVPDAGGAKLDEELVDLLPSFAAYVLAFALVGRFWVIHHRLFETIRAFDGRLMTFNLVFLAMIVLVPFATELWDRYTAEPEAAAVFGLVLGLAAFANWAMIAHVLRQGLVHEHLRAETEPYGSAVALGFTAIFFVSVAVAFLSVTVAWLLWVSAIALRYPLLRRGGRTSS